jgi:hypothetical protein
MINVPQTPFSPKSYFYYLVDFILRSIFWGQLQIVKLRLPNTSEKRYAPNLNHQDFMFWLLRS